jgi:hypothetical protein
MDIAMPGLDVPAEETDPIHCALVCGKSDYQRLDAPYPFLQGREAQRAVSKVIEDDAFPSVSAERGQDITQGNGDAFRRFISHIMIDVYEQKSHVQSSFFK